MKDHISHIIQEAQLRLIMINVMESFISPILFFDLLRNYNISLGYSNSKLTHVPSQAIDDIS